jgi:hypothetical protein
MAVKGAVGRTMRFIITKKAWIAHPICVILLNKFKGMIPCSKVVSTSAVSGRLFAYTPPQSKSTYGGYISERNVNTDNGYVLPCDEYRQHHGELCEFS